MPCVSIGPTASACDTEHSLPHTGSANLSMQEVCENLVPMSADLSQLPAIPLDGIQKMVTDAVIFEGRNFVIERPDASDRLVGVA